ncbi:hypothetical protein ACM79J_31145, partial [Pseudomonas aeruginosa]
EILQWRHDHWQWQVMIGTEGRTPEAAYSLHLGFRRAASRRKSFGWCMAVVLLPINEIPLSA